VVGLETQYTFKCPWPDVCHTEHLRAFVSLLMIAVRHLEQECICTDMTVLALTGGMFGECICNIFVAAEEDFFAD